MNDKYIKLAAQAGIKNDLDGIWCNADQLRKFADLIREDATEQANARANTSWTLMCKKMVEAEREALEAEDWTAIMREGSLVTWGDAQELGDRVLAAIRARGNT